MPGSPYSCCALIRDLCGSASAQEVGPLGERWREGGDHGEVSALALRRLAAWFISAGTGAALLAAALPRVRACLCPAGSPLRDLPFVAGLSAFSLSS